MGFRLITYLVFTLIWIQNSFGDVKFSHLTIKDGLSQSSVKTLFQDSRGFLWIGTADGLNKFDGYHFQVIGSDPNDLFSINGNDISCIYENPYDSLLWIGTQNNGLNLYNRDLDNFISFSLDSKETNKITSNLISDMLATEDKRLWIATRTGGLCYFNRDDSTFISPEFSKLNAFRNIDCLEKDKEGNIWIGTPNGLYKWDYGNLNQMNSPEKVLFAELDQNINALKFDLKGNLWIGTVNNGLFRFHPKSKNIIHFLPGEDPESLTGLRVNDILQTKDGEIWIATSNGLCKHIPQKEKFIGYKNDINNPESLNNDVVYSLLEDRSGIIWIGTYLGGLNKIDPFQTRFPRITKLSKLENGSVSTKDIRSINADANNTVWVGTSSGLVEIKDGNTITEVSNSNSKIHFPDQSIGGLLSINEGLIVSTERGIILLKKNGELISLSEMIKSQTDKQIQRFITGVSDELNNVWLCTVHGILKFIPRGNKFELYNPTGPDGELMTFNPLAIGLDQSGKIWLGTFDGNLYSFDKFQNEFKLVISSDQKHDIAKFSKIFSVYTSIPDQIWLGTNLGLYKYIPEKGEMVRYLTVDGLSNNVVYSAIADDSGNIWCSTNLGVSMLNTETGKFNNYTYQDGLQSNEFNQNACFKDRNGLIYFGGIEGLNIFNPDEIELNSFVPPIVITGMEIQYEKVTPFSHPDVIEKQISEVKKLELNYKLNTFSFEFTALSFSLPQRNKYQYTLTGIGDEDIWINAAESRIATYTNVEPGEYIFKVRGSSSDGIFNEIPASIAITIHPPFWQTWWFRILLVVVIIGVIYFFILFRIRSIIIQKENLQKLVKVKTEELVKQTEQIALQNKQLKETNLNVRQKNRQLNEQHIQITRQRDNLLQMAEQVEEANQTKLRFFTSISHELRTPLTLIINPVKDLLEGKNEYNQNEAHRKLKNVYNNSSKLLHIVNQLLDFRKAETDNLELVISKFELTAFVRESAKMFNELALQKKIDFYFSSEDPAIKIWADRDKLEKTIFNLLSNAFKATKEGGKIHVHTSEIHENGMKMAEIRIKDNGIGIEEDKIPHIFERFYQLNETSDGAYSGSGLGLALVKKYIDIHKGTIEVKSELGKGSEFILRIPSDKKHFGKNVKEESHRKKRKDPVISGIEEYQHAISENLANKNDRDKSTLLIVEDDKDLRNYLKDVFSIYYNIYESSSAEKGFKIAESKQMDVIISDVKLSGMDGFRFCEKLKSNFKTSHIPVIILTSLADKEYQITGIKAGADSIITKPFDLQYLSLMIENLIEGRRRLHKKFSISDPGNVEDSVLNTSDHKFITEAINYIEDNLNNSNFNVEQLCGLLKISQPQCYRKIRAITGFNISEFIRNTRLKKAATLLKNGELKVNEVAYETGFNDPNYFTKSFVRLYGMTPSEYARQ